MSWWAWQAVVAALWGVGAGGAGLACVHTLCRHLTGGARGGSGTGRAAEACRAALASGRCCGVCVRSRYTSSASVLPQRRRCACSTRHWRHCLNSTRIPSWTLKALGRPSYAGVGAIRALHAGVLSIRGVAAGRAGHGGCCCTSTRVASRAGYTEAVVAQLKHAAGTVFKAWLEWPWAGLARCTVGAGGLPGSCVLPSGTHSGRAHHGCRTSEAFRAVQAY